MKKKSAKKPPRAKSQRAISRKPATKKTAKKKPTTKKQPARRKRAKKRPAADSQPSTLNSQPSPLDSPPAWLSDKPAAHWPMVVEQIRQRDQLEMVTPQHVAIYCQTLSRYQAAMRDVETNGFTVTSERGEFVSPAAQIALKLIDHLRHLAKDLGLTERVIDDRDAVKQLGFRVQSKQAAGTN